MIVSVTLTVAPWNFQIPYQQAFHLPSLKCIPLYGFSHKLGRAKWELDIIFCVLYFFSCPRIYECEVKQCSRSEAIHLQLAESFYS